MNRDTSVEDRVKEFFATILGQSPHDIADDTRPASLPAWDSVQHLILVAGFEEEFDVDIEPEEVVEMYDSFLAFRQVIQQKIESAQ